MRDNMFNVGGSLLNDTMSFKPRLYILRQVSIHSLTQYGLQPAVLPI